MNIKYFESLNQRYPEYEEEISWIVDNGYSWDRLRDDLIKDKHNSDAIELGKEYLALKSDIASSYIFLAETYEKTGDISSAIRTYEDGILGKHTLATKLYQKYAKLSEDFYEKDRVIEIYRSFLDRKKSLSIQQGLD